MNTAIPSLAAVALATLLPATAAHAWWACPSGSSIELRNNNSQVRCVSATQYRAHDACSSATHMGVTIGTGIKRDFNGNHDKCVGVVGGVNVVVVDPSCNGGGAGYQLQRRDNPDPDRCRKGGSESAPTVNVN